MACEKIDSDPKVRRPQSSLGGSAKDFTNLLKSEYEKWSKAVKALGRED